MSLLELPLPLTKFINNFFKDRKTEIKVGNFIGPPFPLTATVPQASSISPTVYTNNLPDPAFDYTTIQYAYHGKSRRLMVNRTVSEIQKINTIEKQWKIKTNKNTLVKESRENQG